MRILIYNWSLTTILLHYKLCTSGATSRPTEPRSVELTSQTNSSSSSAQSSDLILFLGKNCHNILSRQPATSVLFPSQTSARPLVGWTEVRRPLIGPEAEGGAGRALARPGIGGQHPASGTPGSASWPGIIGQIMGSQPGRAGG